MPEQLSLFGEENTLYNTAMQQLLDMDFAASREALERYSRLFPWAMDVDRETAIADFWIRKHGGKRRQDGSVEDARYLYENWLEFEQAFGYPWKEHHVEHRFQLALFSRLAATLSSGRSDGHPKLPGSEIPLGLIFLRAGKVQAAVSWLQALIQIEPENAMVYGYLGDAYVLRGDAPTARACYQRAFALDGEQVDYRHLLDTEVRQKLADLQSEERIEDNELGWFPVLAQLEGFFKPMRISDLEELRYWHGRYQALLQTRGGIVRGTRIPLLFYHGMILSDNASIAQSMPELDLIAIRQEMKQLHPELFSLHMRMLSGKK